MNSIPTRSRDISMTKPTSSMRAVMLLLGCCCLGSAVAQSPAVKSLQVDTPRAFGYVIGDVFRHHARLELYLPYRLEPDSIPLQSKLNRWLEVRASLLDKSRLPGVTVYDISLDYQIFNAPSEIQRIATPAHSMMVVGPGGPVSVVIPEWEFSVAPITSLPGADAEATLALRPPRQPPPIPLAPRLERFALMAVIFSAALLYLIWLRWGVPLLARANQPFARAYRDLKRLRRRSFDESVYRQALRRLHGAFNETAGRALFAEQLQAFHSSHPRFGGLEQPIDQLFAESRSVFFAPRRSTPANGSDFSRLIGLCRECRARERQPA